MVFFIEMIFKTHQIQISCFSRHFYEVNLFLVLPQIHWTNLDENKISFIFYDTIFKAMTFSVCSEADQNIRDSLSSSASELAAPHKSVNKISDKLFLIEI